MAGEGGEETPTRTEEESDNESSSASGSGSESEEEPVELLVNTRERRSTAGNRLASLIQQEDPDDELELLFAEADDDEGFEDDEADSDVQMDSSDDDEDQGPTAGADDLEGEKELRRKERAEKLKKRKANDGIPKIFKKKVKIDPTASAHPQAPAPRPKKKSERASWIPTPEDAPTRASQRGTTRQSKEQLHAQMVDREIKRLKQLANMEKAAAAKEAAKKPAMTQADRLAEAARVEKRNFKSLSRWEEAEQQREEEQAAKLAALSNRQMSGPVISWWSGKAEWVGGILKKVGKVLELEDPAEKKVRKRKAAEMESDSAASPAAPNATTDGDQVMTDAAAPNGTATATPSTNGATPKKIDTPPPETKAAPSSQTDVSTGTANGNVIAALSSPLPKVVQTASPLMAPPVQPHLPPQVHPSVSSVLAPPPSIIPNYPYPPPQPINIPTTSTSSTQKPTHPPFILAPPQQYLPLPQFQRPPTLPLDGSAPLPGFGPPPLARLIPSQTIPFSTTPQNQLNQQVVVPPPPPPPPAGPPPIEQGTRNCLILSNFSEDAIKDSQTQLQIIFGRKFPKAVRKKRDHELCAITSYPAKYRDPSTGLPYCNGYAYKEIQKLKRGDYKWSKLVGVYVGTSSFAARGVPPRFLDPKAERCTPIMPPPQPNSVPPATTIQTQPLVTAAPQGQSVTTTQQVPPTTTTTTPDMKTT
ncbi:YL1 nuclear protein-domain-containing protein [Bisporella sp. PMI_857]|nr:YL1 nuclear protein-domain-containing protein [Bisporella sp. PMI_857]